MPHKYIFASKLEAVEIHFKVKASNQLEWETPVVISPGEESLIITQDNPSELTVSKFGMTPSRAKSRMQIFNARAEGDKNLDNNPEFKGSKAIFLKPAFQKPLFSKRCIVIADAFIEWSSGILPHPYLFYLREHKRPIGFAGIYDIWTDPSTLVQIHSFAIITVAANSLIRGIQSTRMPVILSYGQESRWLKKSLSLSEILGMLNKYPSKQMNGYLLSQKIDQPGPYSKEILNPQSPRLLSEEPPPSLPQKSYYGHKKKSSDNSQTLGDLKH